MDDRPRDAGIVLKRHTKPAPNPSVLLIGGSGAYSLPEGALGSRLGTRRVRTPYGVSNPVHLHEREGYRYFFLSRHGERGYDRTAPFVNYRANIFAAKALGVERIIAWSGPGIVSKRLRPGDLVLPDDLLDFTRNRPSTFFEGRGIGFIRQFPVFCGTVRKFLLDAGKRVAENPRLLDGGTYACTEGPRLGGRALDDSLPKYINSTQTPLFDKSGNLYALHDEPPALAEAAVVRTVRWPRGVPRAGTGDMLLAGGVPDQLCGRPVAEALPARGPLRGCCGPASG